MSEKLKEFGGKVKNFLKQMVIYLIVIICGVSGYFIGVYHSKLNEEPEKIEATAINVTKTEVTLAIDENSNLIVINKETGKYTIYENSIGMAVFKLYAKNVWGQHSVESK